MVSTSPLRTVTLWPTACEASVSAAVAPPARAAASIAAASRSSSEVGSGKRPGCASSAVAGRAKECGVSAVGSVAVIRKRGQGRSHVAADRSRGHLHDCPWQGVGYHNKGPRRIAGAAGSARPFSARTMPRPDDPRRPHARSDVRDGLVSAAAPPSKSQVKRDMHALQQLGGRLVTLDAARFMALAREAELPDRLVDAVIAARSITAWGARKRQLQFVGKLMRD